MTKIVAIVFVGPLLIYLVYNYFIDLSFYRRNGWDFSQHSGAADIFPGEIAGPPSTPHSNEKRVKNAYPLSIFVVFVIFLALCFAKDFN
jgi:hypothetical protein